MTTLAPPRNASADPAGVAATGSNGEDCVLRMPQPIGSMWPVEIGGSEPRLFTLETLRQVAMPGGEVPLKPGELFFGRAPARLTTLLGACASVTAWHPRLHIGGLCHYLLEREPAAGMHPDGRYGAEALGLLATAVEHAGLRLEEFELKLFGGGGVLGSMDATPALDICGRNIACAIHWASSLGLHFTARHVGGHAYRRISFDLATGIVDVWCSESVSLAWAAAAEKESL